MSFLDLAKKRCSTRAYQPVPVSQEHIDAIVEAARVAPTAANRQPVRILQVTSEEGLASLAKAANVFDAPLAFVVCADGEKAWKRPLDGMSTVHVDASILTDHMMLAATDLGLGSVWICRFDPTVIREEFGLPETLVPVNILAVGHPAGRAEEPRPPRHRAHPDKRAGNPRVTKRLSKSAGLLQHGFYVPPKRMPLQSEPICADTVCTNSKPSYRAPSSRA